jgi:hypothetical protein
MARAIRRGVSEIVHLHGPLQLRESSRVATISAKNAAPQGGPTPQVSRIAELLPVSGGRSARAHAIQ